MLLHFFRGVPLLIFVRQPICRRSLYRLRLPISRDYQISTSVYVPLAVAVRSGKVAARADLHLFRETTATIEDICDECSTVKSALLESVLPIFAASMGSQLAAQSCRREASSRDDLLLHESRLFVRLEEAEKKQSSTGITDVETEKDIP